VFVKDPGSVHCGDRGAILQRGGQHQCRNGLIRHIHQGRGYLRRAELQQHILIAVPVHVHDVAAKRRGAFQLDRVEVNVAHINIGRSVQDHGENAPAGQVDRGLNDVHASALADADLGRGEAGAHQHIRFHDGSGGDTGIGGRKGKRTAGAADFELETAGLVCEAAAPGFNDHFREWNCGVGSALAWPEPGAVNHVREDQNSAFIASDPIPFTCKIGLDFRQGCPCE